MGEWRAGTKTGRTLWRDEQLVGMVDSPEVAAEIVAAFRAVEELFRLTTMRDPSRRPTSGPVPAAEELESGRERSHEVITYTEHDRIEEQLRKRSPEPFVAVRAEVCGACLSREDVGTDGRFEAHVNSSGQPCSGSRRVAP